MKPFLEDLRIGGDGMKGLAGCGGLSGGLQRQDNQHGFILTFVSAISSIGTIELETCRRLRSISSRLAFVICLLMGRF